MVGRRDFLDALAGAAIYPVAASESEDFDRIEQHREMFLESDGTRDVHPVPTSQRSFANFGAGPLRAKDRGVEPELSIGLWNGSPGLLVEVSDDETFTRTTVPLTTEEARELRDALTRTIEIAEATE